MITQEITRVFRALSWGLGAVVPYCSVVSQSIKEKLENIEDKENILKAARENRPQISCETLVS